MGCEPGPDDTVPFCFPPSLSTRQPISLSIAISLSSLSPSPQMLVSSRLQSPSPNVANAVEDNGHGLLRDVTVSLFLSCLHRHLSLVLHCSLSDRRQVPPRPEATAALPAPVAMSSLRFVSSLLPSLSTSHVGRRPHPAGHYTSS